MSKDDEDRITWKTFGKVFFNYALWIGWGVMILGIMTDSAIHCFTKRDYAYPWIKGFTTAFILFGLVMLLVTKFKIRTFEKKDKEFKAFCKKAEELNETAKLYDRMGLDKECQETLIEVRKMLNRARKAAGLPQKKEEDDPNLSID